MSDWIAALGEMLQSQQAVVMVSVATIKGSTPREVGARMLISSTQSWGTIGGGNLEYQAMEVARNMLQGALPNQLQRFTLGAGLGQCCGGVVSLMFEHIQQQSIELEQLQQMQRLNEDFVQVIATDPQYAQRLLVSETDVRANTQQPYDESLIERARAYLAQGEPVSGSAIQAGFYFDCVKRNDFHLMIFGAGHVGQAVVKIMADQGCRITWVDTRDNQFPQSSAEHVSMICTDTPEAEIAQAAADCFFLVMTHDHQLDQQLCEQILKRDDFAFFGLIGSLTKRRKFEHRLRARGVSDTALQRITCPIGIAGINGKQPAAIALAVAAQVMQIYQQKQVARQPHISQLQAVN